jgi:hypothetical protein
LDVWLSVGVARKLSTVAGGCELFLLGRPALKKRVSVKSKVSSSSVCDRPRSETVSKLSRVEKNSAFLNHPVEVGQIPEVEKARFLSILEDMEAFSCSRLEQWCAGPKLLFRWDM